MESAEDIPQKKKKHSSSDTITIDRALFKSNAWLSLTGVAPQVLTLFLLRRQMVQANRKKGRDNWVCANNGEIIFTYAEAKEKYGITERRFHQALDELIEHGFIDIATPANSLIKQPTKYSISERWRKYGTSDFEKVSRTKRNLTIGFCKPRKKAQIQQEPD